MRTMVMRAKQAVRPLIPDSWMAYLRRGEHSKAVRRNVDIYEPDAKLAKRWLKLTPDTYRVISRGPTGRGPDSEYHEMGASDGLASYLDETTSMVMRAHVATPEMRRMRVSEPRFEPVGLVATDAVLAGLPLTSGAPMFDTVEVAADAGHRIGVIPEIVDVPVSPRRLPIAGDVVVIFAAVPLHDIGGGSRAAQLAFELLRRGYHVVYTYCYPSSEAVDLGLRYLHPRLEEYHIDRYADACVAVRMQAGIAIVEAPMTEFIEPLRGLVEADFSVIYDVIDDWSDRSLGGDWYRRDSEEEIVGLSSALAASAGDLVDHLATFGRDATLVPNAVNPVLFHGRPVPRPDDLPQGIVLGYHGSLYGEWFDWDQLRLVAERYSEATVVVIGDHRGVDRALPSNVVFLGLKPQGELYPYVAHFDVGLVPFVVSDVTHAVSPLKVYEYLAAGAPVAGPPIRPLEGLSGVFVDQDLPEAVAKALAAPKPDPAIALAEHSWGARLTLMFGALGRPLHDVDNDALRIEERKTLHYEASERWIRP